MTVFRLADNVWELGRVLLMCRTPVGKGTVSSIESVINRPGNVSLLYADRVRRKFRTRVYFVTIPFFNKVEKMKHIKQNKKKKRFGWLTHTSPRFAPTYLVIDSVGRFGV